MIEILDAWGCPSAFRLVGRSFASPAGALAVAERRATKPVGLRYRDFTDSTIGSIGTTGERRTSRRARRKLLSLLRRIYS